MKRPQGEGFGFTSTSYGAYQFGWTGQEQFDLNYRMMQLDSNSYYYASGLYMILIMEKFDIGYKEE